MGEGSDNVDEGSQVPSGWGPAEPQYGHSNFQPQYVQPRPQPQYVQPPQQFQQPQYPTPAAPQRRRTRRSSKVEARLRMVQCFEELLSTPVFEADGDPYAAAVQEEIAAFAQKRIDELFGEPGSKTEASGFTPEEAAALKVLAQKMMAPDDEGAEEEPPSAPVPPPPPPPPARGPRGCANHGCQFPPHAPQHPCSNAAPLPRPQPPPQAPQAPPRAPEPEQGPRVVQRPTAAQRAALDAARLRPPPPQPPPQPVYQPPPPPQVASESPRVTRRGKRAATQPAAPPGLPARQFAPPPRRYPMPQGSQMTMVTGQKAEEAIASGGTVLSETFVRAPLR